MEADFIVKYGSNVYVEHSKALDPDLVGFLVGSDFNGSNLIKYGSNLNVGLNRALDPDPVVFLVGSDFIMKYWFNMLDSAEFGVRNRVEFWSDPIYHKKIFQ